jgi:hypothetical protein
MSFVEFDRIDWDVYDNWFTAERRKTRVSAGLVAQVTQSDLETFIDKHGEDDLPDRPGARWPDNRRDWLGVSASDLTFVAIHGSQPYRITVAGTVAEVVAKLEEMS